MCAKRTSEPDISALGLLDYLPKWAAVCTPAIFVCSVIYDYAFLRSLGLSFSEVPTTLGEHVRSSLIWSPILLTVFLLQLSGQYVFMKLVWWAMDYRALIASWEQGRSSDQAASQGTAQRSPARQLFVKVMRWILVFAATIGTLIAADWISERLQGMNFREAVATLSLGWLIACSSIFPQLAFVKRLAKKSHASAFNLTFAVIYVPAVFAMAALFGFDHGLRLLTQNTERWEMVLHKDELSGLCKLSGFRRFELVTIIVDTTTFNVQTPSRNTSSRRVRVIPTALIEHVERVEKLPFTFSTRSEDSNALFSDSCHVQHRDDASPAED